MNLFQRLPHCPTTGKVGFPTLLLAEAELELAREERKAGRMPNRRIECRVYQCPDCGDYHLTARPNWED